MKLSEIADCLFRIPSVEDAFVQQTEDMGRNEFAPVGGAVGARSIRFDRRCTFRVVVRVQGNTCESSARDLRPALTGAFSGAGINLDQTIAKLEAGLDSTQAAPPQPIEGQREDPAEMRDRWRRTLEDYRGTIELLHKLRAWLTK